MFYDYSFSFAESEIEVILTTNEDSNGINNKIIDFTSNIEYLNEDVEIKEIDFDSTSTTTSTVTEHNECSLIFDADSKLIDTGRVRTMISENEVPDCSDGAQKSNIVNLIMNSIDNCEFYLNSEEVISLNKDELDVDLFESSNSEKKIVAQCDTKTKTHKSIKCKVIKDDNEEINNIYSFNDEIIFDIDKYITISSNKDNFRVYCEKNNNDKKKLLIIIVSVCVVVAILTIVIVTVIVCKKKNSEQIKKNAIEDSKIGNKLKNLEKLDTKEFKSKRKSMLKSQKIDTLNIVETDAVMNINENKRKKNKKKNKGKNVKQKTKKKHKSKKTTKKTED